MSHAQPFESIEQAASRLGVLDALLFRRLSPGTWAHLGGLGRGRGWAGIVSVEDGQEPLLAHLPERAGGVHVATHRRVRRVIGPYFALGYALVRLSHDVVVILGNPTGPLSPTVSPDALRALAEMVESSIEDVTPSKRLADELEVLHAVRAVTTGPAHDLTGTLQHIVNVATEAMSCELGLIRDGAGRTVLAPGWHGFDAADPRLGRALDALSTRLGASASLCVQDVDADGLESPLGAGDGVRSLFAVAIPAPVGGMLVTAHTSAGPRGFTDLCQRLGHQIAEATGVVAHTAALREELRAAADEHRHTARKDPLTGLGNRLAWDEALAEAQRGVDAGDPFTVITLDVDGLKEVNDTLGHDAGDDLLRRCALALSDLSRDSDVLVRLGGDEFALLLPVDATMARQRVAALRSRLAGTEGGLAASVGSATVVGGSVADAAREADAVMYAEKRARRKRAHEVLASVQ